MSACKREIEENHQNNGYLPLKRIWHYLQPGNGIQADISQTCPGSETKPKVKISTVKRLFSGNLMGAGYSHRVAIEISPPLDQKLIDEGQEAEIIWLEIMAATTHGENSADAYLSTKRLPFGNHRRPDKLPRG